MNAVPPVIVPILATPFGVASLSTGPALNQALTRTFEQHAASALETPANPLLYRSRDDLFEWPDESVQQLRSAILQGACSVVTSIIEMPEAEFRALRLEARAWFSIVKPDGGVPATSYPLSAWAAVYCVAAPAGDSVRVDSGVLRMYEPRLGSMFQDATSAALHLPFKAAHYSWRPVPGNLAVFPASLMHEIAPVRALGDLVLVTARIRFVAPGQQGIGRW
jgi:hypothetical protein